MKFIDIFNVKHGDFGVYYDIDHNYTCVLDCGTSQPNSCLHNTCLTPRKIIDIICNRISSSTNIKDILISHYHEDHFNGIGTFNKYGLPFFRNLYVPYIDFKANYAKQALYSFCLLKATSEVLQIPFTLKKRFSTLFLDNYAQKNIMLYRGNKLQEIKDGKGVNIEILWPLKHIYGESEELNKFIKNLESTLRKHDLVSAIKETKKYFYELQEQLDSIEFSSLNSFSKRKEELKEIDINKIFSIEKSKEKEDIKKAFRELRKAVKNYLDALSIVFRINNKLLWMGDITEEVLSILKQDLQGDIEYFKLPHHGTRDISSLNIRTSKFIVSISDGKHYQGNNYKPINQNNLEKAFKDNTIIFCTDGHRYCDNNSFLFYLWDYPISKISPFFKDVYCSRNTVVRIDL